MPARGGVHDGATLRAALAAIASDFSFTWIAEARRLFIDLEPRRFEQLHHNPTALLTELTDADLERALTPESLERLERVQDRLVRDRGAETWWTQTGAAGRLPRRVLLAPSSGWTRACRSTPAASACSPATI